MTNERPETVPNHLTKLHSPLPGIFLVSQLAAFGLATILDAYGVAEVWVGHEDSLTFEPYLLADVEQERVDELVRQAAKELTDVIEHDREPSASNHERRPTIWARNTFGKDPAKARAAAEVRQQLVRCKLKSLDDIPAQLALRVCAGLGSPKTWTAGESDFDQGATAFDGAIGNNTSDLVRRVLRSLRHDAEEARAVWAAGHPNGTSAIPNVTPWAPSGTDSDPVTQWLAGVGLSVLPVAHRLSGASLTPAIGRTQGGRRPKFSVVPILPAPSSLARVTMLLMARHLVAVAMGLQSDGQSPGRLAASARLRALGIDELAVYEVRNLSTQSSVRFEFSAGIRHPIG